MDKTNPKANVLLAMVGLLSLSCISSNASSLFPLSSRTTLGIVGIIAAATPFIHGLLQEPKTPAIDKEKLNLMTITHATHAHESWPRANMSSIQAHIRSRSLKETVYSSSEGDLAIAPDIPQESTEPIFIYSHGWKAGPCETWAQHIGKFRGNGVGCLVGQKYLRRGIVNGPMVVFDYPTDATQSFNIGQETDIECLYHVYDYVAKNNPKAPIVLVGDCKGATAILRLITHPTYSHTIPQVKGVVVESPPLSLDAALKQMGTYVGPLQPLGYRVLKAAAYAWLPTYRKQGDCTALYSLAEEHIPKNLPIYVGSIVHDRVASYANMQYFVAQMQKTGNQHVYLFTTNEPLSHQHITKSNAFVEGANAFLKKYNLTHNPAHALNGKNGIQQARIHARDALSKDIPYTANANTV